MFACRSVLVSVIPVRKVLIHFKESLMLFTRATVTENSVDNPMSFLRLGIQTVQHLAGIPLACSMLFRPYL